MERLGDALREMNLLAERSAERLRRLRDAARGERPVSCEDCIVLHDALRARFTLDELLEVM